MCIPGAIAINVAYEVVHKSFAKRNILHQIKSLINRLTIGYFPIFSPIVALGFGGGAKFLFGRAPPPLAPP